ncbi:unnamed protein product, partial [Dovyalis caffra]
MLSYEVREGRYLELKLEFHFHQSIIDASDHDFVHNLSIHAIDDDDFVHNLIIQNLSIHTIDDNLDISLL